MSVGINRSKGLSSRVRTRPDLRHATSVKFPNTGLHGIPIMLVPDLIAGRIKLHGLETLEIMG